MSGSVLNDADCPSRDDLVSFCSGMLAMKRIEAIADHVDECTACESAIETLNSREDPLTQSIRLSTLR